MPGLLWETRAACFTASLSLWPFYVRRTCLKKWFHLFTKTTQNKKTAKSQQNLIFTCAFGWSPECWHVLIGCWHAAVVSWELFGGFKWIMSSDVGYSNLSIFITLLYLSTFISYFIWVFLFWKTFTSLDFKA